MCGNSNIQILSAQNETLLILVEDFIQQWLNPIHHNFKDYFVEDQAYTDGPKVSYRLWVAMFGDQHNSSFVMLLKDFTHLEKVSCNLGDIQPNTSQNSWKKVRGKPSRPKAL